MDRPQFPILHVFLGLTWAQLGAGQGQTDCTNCFQLQPGVIAGVVLGDLVLTLLIALAVYYLTRCIYQRHKAANVMKKSHAAEHESPYQELEVHRLDVYSNLKIPGANFNR